MGEIIVHKNVSSEVIEVAIAPRRPASIPSASQSCPIALKVRRTVQHVHLLGLPGEFTSVTVERVKGDQEDFNKVSTHFGKVWHAL